MNDVHFPGTRPEDLRLPTLNVPQKKITIGKERLAKLRELPADDAASARVEGQEPFKVTEEGIKEALEKVNFDKLYSYRKGQHLDGKMEIVFTIGKDGKIDKITYYSQHKGKDDKVAVDLNTGGTTFEEMAQKASLPLSKLTFDNVTKKPITVRQPIHFLEGEEVAPKDEVKVSKHQYVHHKKRKG